MKGNIFVFSFNSFKKNCKKLKKSKKYAILYNVYFKICLVNLYFLIFMFVFLSFLFNMHDNNIKKIKQKQKKTLENEDCVLPQPSPSSGML